MSTDLTALLTNARWMRAEDRASVASAWAMARPAGTLLLETCHRVELYGTATALDELARDAVAGVVRLDGRDAAGHLVRVAVGRDSSVVAEDQILHQLRRAAHHVRADGALDVTLDRLLDSALRAGRVARSWLPSRRPTLVDLALERAIAPDADVTGRPVLVVGTGEMGRAAAANLMARGAPVAISSRTEESGRNAAARLGIEHVAFDPGGEVIAELAGVVVALKGRWLVSEPTRVALSATRAWVVDMSSPPALDPALVHALRARLVTIDDLATARSEDRSSSRLLARLDVLIQETVDEFERWAGADTRREAADALTMRARTVRAAELEWLWRRIPSLSAAQRAEVERAFDHAAETLLREPLEQLGRDADGRHAEAVRELFRL